MAAWHKKGITGNVRPVVERKTQVLHLLCDFLLNPKTALDFLHDKSGTLHNGATPVTEECNQLNVVHSQGEAATNHILSVRHMKNYKKDNGTHVLKKVFNIFGTKMMKYWKGRTKKSLSFDKKNTPTVSYSSMQWKNMPPTLFKSFNKLSNNLS